jgi:hypothetical protein
MGGFADMKTSLHVNWRKDSVETTASTLDILNVDGIYQACSAVGARPLQSMVRE